jgi:hypothetical protein
MPKKIDTPQLAGPKTLMLEIRLVRLGSSIVAMTKVGGIAVRGTSVPGGVRFAGGVLPVVDDTAAELTAIQSLLWRFARADSADKDDQDARLGLELELAGSTIDDALTGFGPVSFELPSAE